MPEALTGYTTRRTTLSEKRCKKESRYIERRKKYTHIKVCLDFGRSFVFIFYYEADCDEGTHL